MLTIRSQESLVDCMLIMFGNQSLLAQKFAWNSGVTERTQSPT